MPFRVPRFPITADVYDQYGPPFTPRPRSRFTTPCNLKLMKVSFSSGLGGPFPFGILLLVPAKTDIHPADGFDLGLGDVIEAPSGSGRFYAAIAVDDVGKGFANEYRCVSLTQAGYAGPFPIP